MLRIDLGWQEIDHSIPKTPGVYCIKNTQNKRCYIGSTVNLYRRYRHHMHMIRCYQHKNPGIRADSLHSKESDFEFMVLELLPDKELLLEREQYYIDTMRPVYNASPTAGTNRGLVHFNAKKIRTLTNSRA
jgi:group I intron endonuclease